MHVCLGILTSLKHIAEEEERLRKEAEEKQTQSVSAPSLPSLPSGYQSILDRANSIR